MSINYIAPPENRVKISNELNQFPMSDFDASEMNLFYLVCSKVRDRDSDLVEIKIEEIKELSKSTITSNPRFVNQLFVFCKKINSKSSISLKRDKGFIIANLFMLFELNDDETVLQVQVNPRFIKHFNQLANQFTQFDLEEFVALKKKRSKTLYRLLKQWKTIGKYSVSLEELKILLGASEDIASNTFNSYFVKPALEELKSTSAFKTLSVKKIRKNRKIVSYEFTWQRDNLGASQQTIVSSIINNINTEVSNNFEENKIKQYKEIIEALNEEIKSEEDKNLTDKYYGYYAKPETKSNYWDMPELTEEEIESLPFN